LVPPLPVVKTGTVTYNSAYAKNIDVFTRNTNKSVIQYDRLVFGMVEFQSVADVRTQGDYILFTITGVSKPATATPAV
jgi:hypothetical protein